MKTIHKYGICIGFLVYVFNVGCTNLDEKLYSSLNKENFYNNELEVKQAALRPLTHMQAWLAPTGQSGYYYHAELGSDQLAWPQKGKHGYDAGDHFRQHYHTWTINELRLRIAWDLMWGGVGFINAALGDIEALDLGKVGMTEEKRALLVAQLKVLRGFHYMRIMDLWGNVPIVTKLGVPLNPATEDRLQVFNFIKEELEANVDKLPLTTAQTVGEVSRAAGYAMLAELYLNAEKWGGISLWDDCIKACDEIISGRAGGVGGVPTLARDINELFSNRNASHTESLFQFEFSRKAGFAFDWGGFLMGYDNIREVLQVGYGGWNAFVVIPSAFDAYGDKDLRKKDWFLFGPQYKYATNIPILGTEEWNGKPFVYVNSIRRESLGDLNSVGSMAEGEENSGARFNKYKSGVLSDPSYMENKYIIYRLTEIYFNKAEALMRKNGGKATAEAVDLINSVRMRAFTASDWPGERYHLDDLTLAELLTEKGREFIFEGKRRADLIRFGDFIKGSWWDHIPTNDANKEIYPIPQGHRAINVNLKQNPGYPG
ncbi:RagB/SusD family nutrient uptake outer membrane protein [Sphingobacterium sp. MYb382]|uniref:RagB/SusD family nutrient uptake outer membrane protein n=1 Tax=Sphingobacterium sp. MYb382 TaxID=2745278 RepID=UPI0030B001EC